MHWGSCFRGIADAGNETGLLTSGDSMSGYQKLGISEIKEIGLMHAQGHRALLMHEALETRMTAGYASHFLTSGKK